MTSHMKIFNFRKRFYQKVTHFKIIVSKTIIETFKLLNYAKRTVLTFKPKIIYKQDNHSLQKANLQIIAKTNKNNLLTNAI